MLAAQKNNSFLRSWLRFYKFTILATVFPASDLAQDLLWGTIKISHSYDLNREFDNLDSMHKFKLTMRMLWFLCFISCFLIVF